MKPLRLICLGAILCGVIIIAARVQLSRSRKEEPRFTRQELMDRGLELLRQQESDANENYWQPELRAQKFGGIFEDLWDNLNHHPGERWKILEDFAFAQITLPSGIVEKLAPHGIRVFNGLRPGESISKAAWSKKIQQWQAAGWQLEQCEFRHNQVKLGPNQEIQESTFWFSAHLENPKERIRVQIDGPLRVTWISEGAPQVGEIDATGLELRMREGIPPFQRALYEEIAPFEGSYFIDPLIVSDLDHDHRPEIILATRNLILRQDAAGEWRKQDLCAESPRLSFTGMLGDFNGDGHTDYLCAKVEGLLLYRGSAGGRFTNSPITAWRAQPTLKYAQVMTTGDLDHDGDLDLFLGQYKLPFDKGQMPYPYFDAADGYPSFLLLNDGHGNFTDASVTAGLGARRHRRLYSASLIDLNGDDNLDLIQVSDFAGLDILLGDGKGHFKDCTVEMAPDNKGLGMAHGFADFNGDGRLDLLMIGMNSPCVSRLASMGLNRPYTKHDKGMREGLTFGNRLLLGQPGGGFKQTSLGDGVAKTGWSWGCAATDLDGDGFPEIYIANGHDSRQSVRDYETEFWLHDIYVADSGENPLLQEFFRQKFMAVRGRTMSYGGYEKNRFYLNRHGTNFLECGYLFGLAMEADSRSVIAQDMNGDHKPDLLVTTFEAYPQPRQTLHVYINNLPEVERVVNSPLQLPAVNGDSYRAQNAVAK